MHCEEVADYRSEGKKGQGESEVLIRNLRMCSVTGGDMSKGHRDWPEGVPLPNSGVI